ncbi:MAG: type II toxin-antitoxin system VapC family toxin [Sphingomonas sp.]|uniref:type II toxin-antitoxin system VapC family toxin n=1 Tax=Sphingomonas sp. TaxID=28214 RepID=UPI0025F1F946|nr:type II toxin-antitoxin system VapC family toxin [Sphingomonas sp.]MBY0283583.1 type II toxin-antitoxin system VapC family toxin [Sphingomonas sp.]
MIVDSSAVVAMLWVEPEGEAFAQMILDRGGASISAGNYLETGIVIDSDRDPVLTAELDMILQRLGVDIAPVTEAQARIARQAYRDFGKGSGHKAQLNYGDCFAYALAMERGEPLLFKGEDFVHAGVARAG